MGQHYAIWLEENGLSSWKDYFVSWPQVPGEYAKWAGIHSWELPERYHYTRWTGERTIAWIQEACRKDGPFFCWSSFHDPHPAYLVSEPWASMYDPRDMMPGAVMEGEHEKNPLHFGMTQEKVSAKDFLEKFGDKWVHGGHSHLVDSEELKRRIATYYGMVSFMDQEIGRILDALDQWGIAENTLVVFTTDHGHFLGQHGLTAKAIHHYEDLLKVPFLVRWPGRVPAGNASHALQNLVDLAPTFLAAAGRSIPGSMTGLDQTSTWCGGKPTRSWSITENHHGARYFHMRTYINQRYKITVYRSTDEGELFDLQEDPGEISNLWDEPGSQELKKNLLQEFLQAVLESEPERMPRIAGA